MKSQSQKLFKVSEACRAIGLSRYYVNRLILAEKLDVVKIGDAKFVTVESVNKLLSDMMKGVV